jgi:hypothetical protein
LKNIRDEQRWFSKQEKSNWLLVDELDEQITQTELERIVREITEKLEL